MKEGAAMRKAMAGVMATAGMVAAWGGWSVVRGDEATTKPMVVGQSVITERGTLVAVHADGVPVRSVLADVEKQSGVRVRFSEQGGETAGDTLVTLSAEDQPVLEVVKALTDQVGKKEAAWNIWVNGGTGLPVSGVTSAKGAFLMAPEELLHVADYRKPEGQEERLTLKVRVMVDPALRPVLYATQCAGGIGGAAEDEAGHSLAPAVKVEETQKAAEGNGPGDDIWYGETEIVLQRPANAGRRIAKLEGTLPVWVAEKTERFSFDKADTQTKDLDGVKATVSMSVDKTLGGWDLSCKFERPAGMSDAVWAERSAIFSATRLTMQGSEGQEWSSGGSGAGWGATMRSKNARFRAPQNQPEAVGHGVVEVVLSTKRVEAGYGFKDLPLP